MHPVPFIRKESKTNLRLWIIFVAEYQGMFLVISDNVKWYPMVKMVGGYEVVFEQYRWECAGRHFAVAVIFLPSCGWFFLNVQQNKN